MTSQLASSFLADRGDRLAGIGFTERLVPRPLTAFPTAQASQAENPCAEPAAPSSTSQDGAAFSHFTESSCGQLAAEVQESRAGVDVQPSSAGAATSNAIHLPDHAMILLRAIASYEQCSNERAIELALADYVIKIGAGPLARAVLDERERAAGHLVDDLTDVPEHIRVGQNRFRSGGP